MDNNSKFYDYSLFGHKHLSVFVKSLIPFYIRNQYPKFTKFVTVFLEKFNDPKESGVYFIQNMLAFANIDETSGQCLERFCQQYLKDLEYHKDVNKRTLVKWIKQWYEAVGSEQSYKFLFRVLYNEDVDFYYPTVDILRVSDGKWSQDRIIRMTRSMLDEDDKAYYEDMVGTEIEGIGLDPDNLEADGNFPSYAKALVERVRFIDIEEIGYHVVELFVSDFSLEHPIKDLQREEWIRCQCLHLTDTNGDPYTWKERTYSILTGFDIVEGHGGRYFEPGDRVKIRHSKGIEGFAIVNNITSGSFNGIEVIKPGKGYAVGERIYLNDGSGIGAYGYISEIYTDADENYAKQVYDEMLLQTGDIAMAKKVKEEELVKTGDKDAAQQAYWDSLKQTANIQQAEEAYNEAYRDQSNIDEAQLIYDEAIQNGATTIKAKKLFDEKLHELSMVKYNESLESTGNVDTAREIYNQTLRNTGDKEKAEALYNATLIGTGNKDAARRAYNEAYKEKGGIKKVKLGSGGEGYRFFPTIEIDTSTGEGAVLYPHSNDIGTISDIRIINPGFNYTEMEWEDKHRVFNHTQFVTQKERGKKFDVSNVPVPRDIILNEEGEQINKWYDKGRTKYPSRRGGFLVKDFINEDETIEYKGNIDFRSLSTTNKRILEEAVDRKKVYTFPILFTDEYDLDRAGTDVVITFYRDNTQNTPNLKQFETIQCYATAKSSNKLQFIQGRINRIDNERGVMAVTMLTNNSFDSKMVVVGSETNSRGNVILQVYGTRIFIRTGSNILSHGYYHNPDGQISSSKRIQDSYYYQDFSYVLDSKVPQKIWDKAVHDSIHPAGTIAFGIGTQQVCTYGPSYAGHPVNTAPLIDEQPGSIIYQNIKIGNKEAPVKTYIKKTSFKQ